MRITLSRSAKALAVLMTCLLDPDNALAQKAAAPELAAPELAAPEPALPEPSPEDLLKAAVRFQQDQLKTLDQRIEKHRSRRQALDSTTTATAAEAESKRVEQQRSDDQLQALLREREAVLITIEVLMQNKDVSAADAKKALAIQEEYLRQVHEAGYQPAARALQTSTDALRAIAQPGRAAPAAADVRAQEAPTVAVPKSEAAQEEIEFGRGGKLRYGPTISLLRFSVARDRAEPGRYRNYQPQLEFIPAEFGFAFVFQPHNRPWRINRRGNGTFQLMSVGGMLLTSIDKNDVSRGSLSLAATLGFFQDIVGLGIGMDLYRGIETAGPGGAVGKDTAYTGLLAWSLSPRGEVTPENVFFVVTLGLVPLVNSITGELK